MGKLLDSIKNSKTQTILSGIGDVKSQSEIKAIEEAKYKAVVPRNCIDEDKKIREIDVRIAALTAAQLKTPSSSYPFAQKTEDQRTIDVLQSIRTAKKLDFNNWNCVNEIEKTKLVETRDILSEGLDQYDEDVLEKSAKQQNTLLAVGGAIILVGLLIVLKFTKK